MFSFSEYLIKIYGLNPHGPGSLFTLQEALLQAIFQKLPPYQFALQMERADKWILLWAPRDVCLSGRRRSRAGTVFWPLLNLLMPKRASDLPSKIFTLGKFYVPDRHTPEGDHKRAP